MLCYNNDSYSLVLLSVFVIINFYRLILFTSFLKLGLHRWILVCQLANRKTFCLIIGKSEVVLATYKGLPDLLKMIDSLVYFINGSVEFLTCQTIVLAKLILKFFQLVLEIGYIHLLALGQNELFLVLQTLLRGLNQQIDERNKELRANHIHLRIEVRLVHNTIVVEVILGLQQADEYRALAEKIEQNDMFVIPKPMTQERLEEILFEYGLMENIEDDYRI